MGRTVNMSRTGVFFWTEDVMEMLTGTDMGLEMSVDLGEHGAEIFCRGEIVRTVWPDSPDSRRGLAARIRAYRLVRSR